MRFHLLQRQRRLRLPAQAPPRAPWALRNQFLAADRTAPALTKYLESLAGPISTGQILANKFHARPLTSLRLGELSHSTTILSCEGPLRFYLQSRRLRHRFVGCRDIDSRVRDDVGCRNREGCCRRSGWNRQKGRQGDGSATALQGNLRASRRSGRIHSRKRRQ